MTQNEHALLPSPFPPSPLRLSHEDERGREGGAETEGKRGGGRGLFNVLEPLVILDLGQHLDERREGGRERGWVCMGAVGLDGHSRIEDE